ncbi:MAG TPA: hypothetical protein GYA10_16935 [Alphaproteobacteria bacterium]|nr:hypothetical protein [Alphaproteobacteria bacterium]
MQLRPILRPDADAAAAMLSEGFRTHSAQRWLESVHLLFSHVGHTGDGSIGYVASVGGRDVGICLAIPARRSAYETEPRDVVNFAAFYLRPGNEWMATPFLRRMMRDPTVEYLDLTATISMREVNRRLGFTDRSRGMVVVPTAVAALRPGGGARIIPLHDISPDMLSPDHHRLLVQHDRLHGMSLVAEIDGAFHPLIFAWSLRKGVWGARVVLARDRDLIRAVLGPLSRYLLRRGLVFLEFDGMSNAGIPESIFTAKAAPVQSTRPSENPAIDHTFSELMFIPPPSVRPRLALLQRRSSTLPFPLGMADAGIAATPAAGLVLCLAETVLG